MHYFVGFISVITLLTRFVIPVVFYEIINIECVYWSNKTVFIGRM